MADDRYNWLDEETAERLLRGLPVDAQNSRRGRKKDRARERNRNDRTGQGALNVPGDAWFEEADRRTAERLASVLDALATEHTHVDTPAHGSTAVELPGEAAALDAFRAARVGVLHSGSVGMTGATNDSGSDSASVGGSAAAGGPGRGERRGRGRRRAHGERRIGSVLGGRPLRAGFAVALAGCALGGVAVAAGAGVLPTPFGGKGTPAVSVSPVETPDEERVGGSGGASSDPSEDDDTRDTSGGEAERDPDGKKSEKSGSPDDHSSASDGPSGKSRDKNDGHGNGQGEDEDGKGGWDGRGGHDSPDKQAVAIALCKAYDEGKLSSGDRRKLERAAGGRTVVQTFCAKYGSTGGGSDIAGGAGSVGGGGANGGPGGSGNSGGSGGNHDTGGGTGGSTGKPGDAGGSTGGDEDGGSSAGSGGEDDSGGSATSGTTSGSASVAPGTVTGATPAG